jgi:hypothetical protein
MHCTNVSRYAAALAALPLACASAIARGADAPPACGEDARFEQQDFALGDWDVYEGGKKSATVRLEKVLKGCAIQETWKPLEESGEHGIGVFTYSRLLGHWGYFWVADNGQTTQFSGDSRSTNDMLYVTYAPVPGGGKKERHWTLKLQPDGSLQELSVGSTDGKSWTKEYELIWRKPK